MSIVRKADIRTGLTAALLLTGASLLQGCAGDVMMPDYQTAADSTGIGDGKCIIVNGVLICD